MAWTVILKGFGVVTLLGSTIAVPVTVSKFFGPKPIDLKDLKDFKKHCVVIGPKNNSQILGCQATTTGESVDFYLYKKDGSGSNNPSFSKIKSVKSEERDGNVVVTFFNNKTPSEEKTEKTKLDKSNKLVTAVSGLDLKGRCKTDWSKFSKDKKQKFNCKNSKGDLTETEEFEAFSGSTSEQQ